MKGCPLCRIPGKEFLLYEDEYVYLCRTKDLKGHDVRVMVATKRHVKEPSFVERTLAYHVLFEYMRKVMGGDAWFVVDSTYASVPDHFHLIACDNRSIVPEEVRKGVYKAALNLPEEGKYYVLAEAEISGEVAYGASTTYFKRVKLGFSKETIIVIILVTLVIVLALAVTILRAKGESNIKCPREGT